MIDQATKDIDGVTYKVTPFGARQGFRLQRDLARIAKPALEKIIGATYTSGKNEVSITDVDVAQLTPAIGLLVDSLYEVDPNGKLLLELFERTLRDDMPVNDIRFDTIYAANYGEMVKALIFIIQANRFFMMSGTGNR